MRRCSGGGEYKVPSFRISDEFGPAPPGDLARNTHPGHPSRLSRAVAARKRDVSTDVLVLRYVLYKVADEEC